MVGNLQTQFRYTLHLKNSPGLTERTPPQKKDKMNSNKTFNNIIIRFFEARPRIGWLSPHTCIQQGRFVQAD